MKANVKKTGFYAAMAAILLITALLITNCLEPLEMGLIQGQTEEQGTAVRIVLGGDFAGRTIMPVVGDNAFTTYQVVIESDTPGVYIDNYNPTNTISITIDGSTISLGTISAGVGYTFTVNAYVSGNGASGIIAATGQATGVDVSSSSPTNINNLALNVVKSGANGTFGWNITGIDASNADTATIEILQTDGTALGGTPLDFEGDLKTSPNNDNATVTLPAGLYKVVVTLDGSSSNHQTRVYEEILHVYAGMKSNYSLAVTALTRNRFVVTYSNAYTSDGTPDTTTATPQKVPFDTAVATKPTNPINTLPSEIGKQTFDGWWTATSGGSRFIHTDEVTAETYPGYTVATKVTADTIVYARFIGLETGITFNFTFPSSPAASLTLTGTIDGSPVNNLAGVSRTDLLANDLLLTLNGTISGWSVTSWTMGGAPVGNPSGTNTLSISAADLDNALPGTHTISIILTVNSEISESKTFDIVIVNP